MLKLQLNPALSPKCLSLTSHSSWAFAYRIWVSALLLLFVPLARGERQADAVAEPPEAQSLLAAVHEYAARYVSTLPDFICLQTIEQFESGKKTERWHQLDTLASRLVFAGGREHRTLELVNGHKPAPGLRMKRRPLTTEGEFAILIANIFGESSQAHFEWQGWQVLHGQRCAVFAYHIDQDHSTVKLTLSDLASATVAYGGQVFAEATGSIRRVTSEANDIPREVQTRRIATVIDYSPVTVGTGSYLLPAAASVQIETPSGHVRNELHFSEYRKFEAASSITFDSDPATPAKPPI